MPGYVMHLACGNQVIKNLEVEDSEWKNQFLLGSIAPDAHEKKASHFWDDEIYKRFTRYPNLDMFLDEYGDKLKEPFIYGYFAHLYLDYVFVEGYWKEHFAFYDAQKNPTFGYEDVSLVKLVDNQRWYEREEFFSNRLFYGDYDLLNAYMYEQYEVGELRLDTDLTQIKEAPILLNNNKMQEMLDTLKELHRKKETSLKPPLNILNLSDLCSMIETAAKEIARRYA